MRSMMVGTVVALVVSTLAASGSAQEPEQKPTARPRIEIPQVRVSGFHRSGQTGAYTGGALGVAVDVENTGNQAVDGVVVKLDVGEQVLERTLSIPARSTRSAIFSDSEGLESSCKPKPYTIALTGPRTSSAIRTAHITPSCSFKSTIEETWNLMSPDRVEANKTGNVYLSAPSLVSGPTCGKGPTMKVRMISHASMSSPSVIVQAKEWTANGQVKAQTAAAFPIAPNEMKELLLTPVSGGNGEVPEKLALSIVDWTKSLGGHTSNGGIFLNTTRSCALDFDLE